MIESNIVNRCYFDKPELSIFYLLFSNCQMSLCLIHGVKGTCKLRQYSLQIQRVFYRTVHFQKSCCFSFVCYNILFRRIGINAKSPIWIIQNDVRYVTHLFYSSSQADSPALGGSLLLVAILYEEAWESTCYSSHS